MTKSKDLTLFSGINERLFLIISPWFLISLGVLIFNDYYLKVVHPSIISGKLSDFAGLFVFPIFMYVIIGGNKKVIYVLSGLAFIIWKSPYSSPLIDIWNQYLPFRIGRVVDYTDLVALISILLAYYYKPSEKFNFQIMKKPVLRWTILGFSFVIIIACEGVGNNYVLFKNKPKGTIPYGLEGMYEVERINSRDSLLYDTVAITRIQKDSFSIKNNRNRNLFQGHIRKWKNYYFTSVPNSSNDKWHIQGFKIDHDSVYNFPHGFYWSYYLHPNTINLSKAFEQVEDVSREDTKILIVDQSKKELRKSFKTYLESEKGEKYRRILIPNEELESTTQKDSTESSIVTTELSELQITTYPNPFQKTLNIEIKHEDSLLKVAGTLEFLAPSGQIVSTYQVSNENLSINVQDLEPGTYTLKILVPKHKPVYKRVIKQ